MSLWRAKASACFALARSSTFEGERQNAIARGLAIIAKNGGSADDFDIPGRPRRIEEKQRWTEYEQELRRARDRLRSLYGENEADERRCQMEHVAAAYAAFKAKLRDACLHGVPSAYPCPDCDVANG